MPSLTLTTGSHQPAFCLCGLNCSGHSIEMESGSVWPFVWFCHFTKSLRFIYVVAWNTVWIHTTFCLFILQLVGFWFVNSAAVNIRVYKYLFKCLFSILWGYIPRSGMVDHMVILCLLFWRTVKLFSTGPLAIYKGSKFVHILAHICYNFLCVCVCVLAIPLEGDCILICWSLW